MQCYTTTKSEYLSGLRVFLCKPLSGERKLGGIKIVKRGVAGVRQQTTVGFGPSPNEADEDVVGNRP